MGKRFSLFLILASILLSPCYIFAQSGPHDLVIPDYKTNQLYLNDEIMGDTTDTGARKDPDRVYVLKSGGTYLVDVSIRNTDWALRIKAEDGAAVKPTIYAFEDPDNSKYPGQVFDVQGDLYLTGLNIVGWTETYVDQISAMPSRIINVSTAGPSLYIDDCVLSGARATIIQTSSAAHVVKITNTIMAQSGNLFNTNIGNGRYIDCRNVSIDSLIVQNCSLTDCTDRAIRHYSSIGPLGYVLVDHNTIRNDLSMHGFLAFGWVSGSVQVTNNVWVDNFALGNDSTDDVRLAEFGDPNEFDQYGNNRMTMLSCLNTDSTETATWDVSNNYYAVTDSIQMFYNQHSDIGLGNLIPATWYINKKIKDSTTAVQKDNITFEHATHSLYNFCEWYWTPDPNGPGKSKNTTNFSSAVDYQRPMVAFYSDTSQFNLAYNTSSKAYTGDVNGKPAGDPRWFNGVTAVAQYGSSNLPSSFSLKQNYPNPFNPSTMIEYNVPKESNVKLQVYDILGRLVATLVNENKAAGKYSVNFNASNLSSGVYIYQLSTPIQILTKKMMLLK